MLIRTEDKGKVKRGGEEIVMIEWGKDELYAA